MKEIISPYIHAIYALVTIETRIAGSARGSREGGGDPPSISSEVRADTIRFPRLFFLTWFWEQKLLR